MTDEETSAETQATGCAENSSPQETEKEKEWFFELLSEMRI